ncbi:MAG: hypothetical protein IJ507_06205 [Clostridia bacterium]|nr:hypothetical protein [Clostridia bacterium]
MDHSDTLSALLISRIHVRLGAMSVSIMPGESEEDQIRLLGDESSFRAERRDGTLFVTQKPRSRAQTLSIVLPLSWKGALDVATLRGGISVFRVSGTDFRFRSLTGAIRTSDLVCMTLHMSTLTGKTDGNALSADRCLIRTLTGGMLLTACDFLSARLRALRTRAEMDLSGTCTPLSLCCLMGSATVYVPFSLAHASVRSVRGQLVTDGVFPAPGAPRITMTSVTANLQLICSLDEQAATFEEE